MNLYHKALIGLLTIALVVAGLPAVLARPVSAASPPPNSAAQTANPAVDVQVYLESQGYAVRKVSYIEQNQVALVVMDMVSGAFDELGREQIVQGWYALARAYLEARDLWCAVVYQEQYIIVFQVVAQDLRDWVDGKITPADLHYTVMVVDSATGRYITDKDFIRKNFTGTRGGQVQTVGALPQLRFAGLWLLYRDDFSDPLSGWEVSEEDGGSAGYVDGAYRLTMAQPDSAYWAPAPGRVREFAFAVKATQTQGDARNPYGILFSYQDDDNLCAFLVTGEGHYTIVQLATGEARPVQPWTTSNALKQGQLPNLLRVEVQEDEVRAYANGQLLAVARVAGLQKGQVGLVAATFDQPPTAVLFDDVALFGVNKDWQVVPASVETHKVQPLRREPVPAAAHETLQALTAAEAPAFDLYTLAVRTGEIPPDTPRTLKTAPSYQVGDTETLYVSRGDKTVELKCKLAYIAPGTYAWVEDGQPYDEAELKAVTDLFDQQIAPQDRAFFGSEWTPGVDNDPRIHILNFDAGRPGLCGYFQSTNEYPRAVFKYSNQREMFFMNSLGPNAIPLDSGTYRSTLAHEFQHMIHWNSDANEETWLNEGSSMLAEYLNGYPPDGQDVSFSRQPDTQLNVWEYGDNAIPHYGNAYLFMTYFVGRFGQGTTQAAAKSQANGTTSFDELLKSQGLTFDDVFNDYVVALYINDRSLSGGHYAFPDGVDAVRPRLSQAVNGTPASELTDVHQYAADYIKLNPGLGDVRVDFTGSSVVPIGPGQAHSGDKVWWFGWGDRCDATLTSPELDLSSVSQATLKAMVWYDGGNKMYFSVLVSVDGGQTWRLLSEYEGHSGDGPEPAWIPLSVDLSEWAGRKVQVRFEALAVGGGAVGGLALDEVNVPEIGYRYDPDDDGGGWQAEGFVHVVPLLPQHYTVQVIEFDGDRAMAVRRMELDGTNRGSITINGLTGNRSAVLVVTAHTPYAGQWASYEYQVSAQ